MVIWVMDFKLIHINSFIWRFLKPILFAVVLLFTEVTLFAQQNPESHFKPNLQIGISAGSSLFFGDLKQNNFFPVSTNNNEWRFAYGINMNYCFSPSFMMRIQGLYGELSGTKRDRNIWFENDYYEINLNTLINISNLFGKKREDRLVNFFGAAGFGILNFNSVVKRMNEYYVLKRVGYGYGTGFKGRERQPFYMIGAGIDFRISHRIDFILETANKYVFTDLLDGMESGKHNDVYNYTSVGIVYRFSFSNTPGYKSIGSRVGQELIIPPMKRLGLSYVLTVEPDYTPIIKYKEVDVSPMVVKEEESFTKIEFRVQILAEYRNPYSKEKMSKRFNIPTSEISEDVVNKYYVYSVGTFPNYSLARKKCSVLKSENGVSGAFVVAYKDGKRIFPVKK